MNGLELVGLFAMGALAVAVIVILYRAEQETKATRSRPERDRMAPSYSEALSDLHQRVSALEESDAEQRLLVLDTAEKVATRFNDRVRKRRKAETRGYDQDELDDREDDESDPDVLLARAKAAYPLPDINQMHLPLARGAE